MNTLTSDEIQILKQMNLYWQEIAKREDNRGAAIHELNSVMGHITPMNILLLMAQGLNCISYPKECVIKEGWQHAGKQFKAIGPEVAGDDGMKWVPILPSPNESGEDPTFHKAVGLKYL